MGFRFYCIQHPTFAFVLNAVLLVAGLYALVQLPLRYLPKFEIPVAIITTTLPGGSPTDMESSVTRPLEQAVSLADGIDYIASTSEASTSIITIFFKSGVDPEAAANDLRAKVNSVTWRLPDGTLTPQVQSVSYDSQPSIYVSLSDPNRNALELTDIVEQRVRPLLTRVPGVSGLQMFGQRLYSIRIELDRFSLAQRGLTVDEVVRALQTENAVVPGGEIINDQVRISVVGETQLTYPSEFEALTLRSGTNPVRLGDVARIEVAPQSSDTAVQIDGTDAIAVGVQRLSNSNPVEISAAVRALLPDIRAAVPPSVKVEIAYDNAVFINAAMQEVVITVLIAIALVVGVVILFLGSLRSSLIVMIAIPLSLGGGLAFLALMGYSINTFTLLAFVLVIGLVVDDAIVEVENVQRHVDDGMSPLHAGFKGSREIGFAVMAMTATLAAVYAPIGLMPGMTGSLFREFGLTLAMTVIVSGFVAMTLTPMLCTLLLRPQTGRGLSAITSRAFDAMARGYKAVLSVTLRVRWLVVLIALAVAGAGFATMSTLPSELAPEEDQGYLLVMFDGPSDASPAYLSARAEAIEKAVADVPERVSTMSLIGTPTRSQGMVFILLKPWSERSRTAMEIERTLVARLDDVPGARVALINPDPLAGGFTPPIQFVLRSTLSYTQLASAIEPFLEKVRALPELYAVRTDLDLTVPVEDLVANRERAGEIGISMVSLASAVGKLLDQEEVVRFSWDGTLYPVLLGLASDGAIDPEVLSQVYLRASDNQLIPISAVAEFKRSVGASSYGRFDQLRSATMSANIVSGASSSALVDQIERIAAETLPQTVDTAWTGQVRQLKDTSATTGLVFLLGFAVIYLVLAAQFDSFRDPFIILSVAPLSLAGAAFALELSGSTLNLYSGVGMITLIGLIAKHGILITEFTNQLRDQGMDKREAVLEAASIRLRPILMTTAAMVLGAAPLAFASGAGAVSRSDIGWTIVGGMLFGTTLSIFVIPSVYMILSRRHRRVVPPIPSEAELDAPAPKRA